MAARRRLRPCCPCSTTSSAPWPDKGEDATAVREGFQLIMKKLEKILEGLGVRPIDTKDKDFDVDFHEAIAMVPAGDDQKGKVIDCVQTGYTLNDKVIRHAKVAVGQ